MEYTDGWQLLTLVGRTFEVELLLVDAERGTYRQLSRACHFCRLVRSGRQGYLLCELTRRNAVRTVREAGTAVADRCHAGLGYLGVPVGTGAVLLAGGLTVPWWEGPDPVKVARITGADREAIQRHLTRLPVRTPESIRRLESLMCGAARTLTLQQALVAENRRLKTAAREAPLLAVRGLVRALEAKDPYTRGHSERVAALAAEVAVRLSLTPEEVEGVRSAALLHDVGKIGIREDVLNKHGRLTPEEWSLVRQHPLTGAQILVDAGQPAEIIAAVRHHHENYDGSGYPAGLAGEAIPLFARIIRAADACDAMQSMRAYRPALSGQEVRAELRRGSGTAFDPQVVAVLLRLMADRD